MSDKPIAHTDTLHTDKYNDPRVRITGRGVAIAIGVLIVAAIAAGLSIYQRRTRLGRTTAFFGPSVIEALQLAERIDLIPSPIQVDAKPLPEIIPLTATPGLGHLRRALLDDRHYDWDAVDSTGAAARCDGSDYGEEKIPGCVSLRLTDPTLKRFDDLELDLDLIRGRVGLAGSNQSVAVTDYVRPKLQSYFKTIINVSRLTYDQR